MRPPMQPPQPPRFIAAAPAAAALLLFNVPSLWLLVHIQQWVDLFDSRLPERQPRCSAKWIFSFLEGTVSSSGISLFKPSGKPRNSNRRHKKTAQIRPTRSNFHFLVGTFQKRSSFLSSRGAFAWRTVGSVLFDELVFALERRQLPRWVKAGADPLCVPPRGEPRLKYNRKMQQQQVNLSWKPLSGQKVVPGEQEIVVLHWFIQSEVTLHPASLAAQTPRLTSSWQQSCDAGRHLSSQRLPASRGAERARVMPRWPGSSSQTFSDKRMLETRV